MTAQIAAHGRIGKDPKQIATKTGTTMAAASIAVDVSQREEQETLWLNVVAFGHVAESLLRHSQGDLISVAGRLQQNRWQTPEGEERVQLQVVADSLVSARSVRPAGGRRRAA